MTDTHPFPQQLLDHLATGIVVTDRQLDLVFINSAAEDLFEISLRQALGMGLRDLVSDSGALLDAARRCLDSGCSYAERGLALQLLGGRDITVDCALSPFNEVDTPPALLLEFQQIDRLVRIDREELLLTQQQTSRELIRNLAHEIKNPLGGLRGAAQLLERELPDIALKEYTRIIIGEADRLRGLVDRMLGPTQLPVYRELNIHEVCERVRQLILAEAGPGIVITQDYDPSIPSLRGDPDQLIQALLNIARNAVQALAGRGDMVFRSRILRQYTLGHTRHKLLARIEVVDHGPGIPEALREAIFYPLISGHEQGTGLGLSIAQALVNQHGGLIECASRAGETVFSLLLPVENTQGHA